MSKGGKVREIRKMFMRIRFAMIILEPNRTKWLKKHSIFAGMGDNIHFAPRFYPTDAYRLMLHNNITIARDVNFIMHDVLHLTLNNMPECDEWINQYWGCIEIMDNVAIGSGAQICPNVRIGPNAIVGAGAIVTKDVPPGTVVAGVPARVIGTFDDFFKKRIAEGKKYDGMTRQEKMNFVWREFYESRGDRSIAEVEDAT